VTVWEHYAVAPGEDAGSFVAAAVVGEDLFRLPDILEALEPLIGEPPYLRLAGHVQPEPDRYLRLHVFDAGASGDPRHEIPAELRPALESWLAELRGAPVPAQRPAWSRPGWLAAAEDWVGCALRPARVWPLSAVLRGERGYMKAVFPLFHHEPAVTEALAREHPGAVPDVVRVDHERGWMLMREIEGTLAHSSPRPAAALVVRKLAEIQRTWSERTVELFALGGQDRRVATPDLGRLPETLVHGDFHAGNALVDGGRAVIFDWSDACVAHPLFDLHVFLFGVEDEQRRAELVDAYAEGWGGDVSADEVRAELQAAARYSCLHQAESYRAIQAALAPEDQWWFADAEQQWRERAVAAG
jgi:tRNA A-37 threonylcarbamoyl transferase component Bud32